MKFLRRRKKKIYEDKYYETRRAAFRAAKRDNNIPSSKQPEEVISPSDPKWKEYGLDKRNRRLFRFITAILNLFTGYSEEREIHIREDKNYSYHTHKKKGDQSDHFNSGEALGKLKRHHYYKRKNKK